MLIMVFCVVPLYSYEVFILTYLSKLSYTIAAFMQLYFATEDVFIVNYLCSSCRALDLTPYFRLINKAGCVAAYVCVCKSAHATFFFFFLKKDRERKK